jgi:hypothetical protein
MRENNELIEKHRTEVANVQEHEARTDRLKKDLDNRAAELKQKDKELEERDAVIADLRSRIVDA